LAGTAASAHTEPRAETPSWAHDFLKRWYVSYNAGDAAGVAMLFAPDARLGEISGRAAIEASLASDFERTTYRCTGRFDGIRVLGTLAVAWGYESCLETSKANGDTRRTDERWLLTFRHQANGSWLLADETFEPVKSSGAVY